MLAVNAHLMLAVNAHLMLAVIPIIYRQCKGTTKFELHKEKERFFQLPSYFIPSLYLLYSFFIATLFPTAEHRSISSERKSPRSGHRRRCGSR